MGYLGCTLCFLSQFISALIFGEPANPMKLRANVWLSILASLGGISSIVTWKGMVPHFEKQNKCFFKKCFFKKCFFVSSRYMGDHRHCDEQSFPKKQAGSNIGAFRLWLANLGFTWSLQHSKFQRRGQITRGQLLPVPGCV